MNLREPWCTLGYPLGQLDEVLGVRKSDFEVWFRGQTGAICDASNAQPCPGGPHGFVVYRHDVQKFLQGRRPVD